MPTAVLWRVLTAALLAVLFSVSGFYRRRAQAASTGRFLPKLSR